MENADEYFDFDTTMTYYIMTNALLLRDNYAKNLMLITYDGEVWYPILYDLDTSFGSNPYGSSLYDNDFSCEIERNGAKGDTNTTYKVFPLAQEKDNTLIKDLPEFDDLLGGYVLDLSFEDMEEFLQTGKVQGMGAKQEENLPRRTSSRSNKTETQSTEQTETRSTSRRTASRF